MASPSLCSGCSGKGYEQAVSWEWELPYKQPKPHNVERRRERQGFLGGPPLYGKMVTTICAECNGRGWRAP